MNVKLFNRPLVFASIFMERYVLSLALFYRAWAHWRLLMGYGEYEQRMREVFPLLEIFRQFTWSQLLFFSGLMLLIGRPVKVPPQAMKDLLVPIIVGWYNLLYDLIPSLPAEFNQPLYPPAWLLPCISVGLALNILGFCICIWAVVSLGRSFGLFIEVRTVVIRGAYRWVRHPIYFGYLFLMLGFAMENFNLAFCILLPIHIVLLLYRARLEEKRLAESSAEYRDYQKRTGFIFPKFFKPRASAGSND
jgi:protein-S-isoprenylcysteine O-methyltransferase Ste14